MDNLPEEEQGFKNPAKESNKKGFGFAVTGRN